MAHFIEEARSARAACRTCKEPIAKGELRLGIEVPSQFGSRPMVQWYHLACAADDKPAPLASALSTYPGAVAEREVLERRMELAMGKLPPTEFPFAERGAHAATCDQCGRGLPVGALRVVVEHQQPHRGYVRLVAAYLHPACARRAGFGDADEALIRTHSRGLSPDDLDAIAAELAPQHQHALF